MDYFTSVASSYVVGRSYVRNVVNIDLTRAVGRLQNTIRPICGILNGYTLVKLILTSSCFESATVDLFPYVYMDFSIMHGVSSLFRGTFYLMELHTQPYIVFFW